MTDASVFRFPATIEVIRTTDAELVELAKKDHAFDASVFDDHEPFFWDARISNTRLDSYFTHMMVSSLRNYSKDAQHGVAFLDSHKSDSLARTLGRSLQGRYQPKDEEGYAETFASFYTLRQIDPIIDTFITKVRAGLASHVSIGFYGGRFMCSICKRDMLSDWDCWHYPGFMYSKDGKRATDEDQVLCTAAVEDANLAEVSIVYHGATPGAGIIKAQRALQEKRLPQEMARRLEDRYHVRLLTPTQIFVPSIDYSPVMEELMGKDQTPLGRGTKVEDLKVDVNLPTEDLVRIVQEKVDEIGQDTVDAYAGVRDLLLAKGLMVKDGTIVDAVRALITRVDELVPQAKDGETYRATLIEEALTEGARAYGNTFDRETYEGHLKDADLRIIKRMRDDWAAGADLQITSGRKIKDDGDETPATNTSQDGRRFRTS